MKNNYTHVTNLLDRSGSMCIVANDDVLNYTAAEHEAVLNK